jgi:hypothetical protein
MSSKTLLHSTNQGRTDAPAWQLWHQANRLWGDRDHRLKQPLGRWLCKAVKLCQEWHYYHDPVMDELLVGTASTNKFMIHPHTLNGYSLLPDGQTNHLPDNKCVLASLICTNTFLYIRRQTPLMPSYPDPPIGTFDAFLASLPEWEQILLKHISLHCNLYMLYHCLSTRQECIGVSNGLVRVDMGAFSWCMSQSDDRRLATGMVPAQGMAPRYWQFSGLLSDFVNSVAVTPWAPLCIVTT